MQCPNDGELVSPRQLRLAWEAKARNWSLKRQHVTQSFTGINPDYSQSWSNNFIVLLSYHLQNTLWFNDRTDKK